jgi:hypothetical protein
MPTTKIRTLRSHLAFERVDAAHSARGEIEAFIAQVYQERYGACLNSFLPHLLAFRDQTGELQAAIGLRYGSEGPFFVEQYLDQSAELALAARLGRPVGRGDLVEVGNFASQSPGDARSIIVRMTELLHEQGIQWVLFAATPDRLREGADGWGRYYDAQPSLVWGDIAAGHAHLHPHAAILGDPRPIAMRACGCAP